MKVAMTIAGSDSGGGAGVQADLKTFAAHGVHGVCALTAVTAQSTVEVRDWVALEPRLVVAQIDTVADDIEISAVKTGMLANAAVIVAVAEALRRRGLPRIVVDPVMVAKGGQRLLDRGAENAYVERLFPLAALVTPNLPEAEVLLGRRVRTLADMREAARALHGLGPGAVVVKGGHLPGAAVDVFFDGVHMEELAAARIVTKNTHGTGCTFSAAIAGRLANGAVLVDAVRGAKEYLTEAIRCSYSIGRGHGPVDHLHLFRG